MIVSWECASASCRFAVQLCRSGSRLGGQCMRTPTGLFLRRRAVRFAAQVLNPIAAVPLCVVLSGLVRLQHCPTTGAIPFVTAPATTPAALRIARPTHSSAALQRLQRTVIRVRKVGDGQGVLRRIYRYRSLITLMTRSSASRSARVRTSSSRRSRRSSAASAAYAL